MGQNINNNNIDNINNNNNVYNSKINNLFSVSI